RCSRSGDFFIVLLLIMVRFLQNHLFVSHKNFVFAGAPFHFIRSGRASPPSLRGRATRRAAQKRRCQNPAAAAAGFSRFAYCW
ncbi:MAG: hypothetical protein II028_03600, partial [Clostridia bacterium]|nr:hypothetical protein [Clostridia bacterium]